MITIKSIEEKLGFDPTNPPEQKMDGFTVDDSKPSIWAPLNLEELIFVLENCFHVDKEIVDEFRLSLTQ